MKNKGIFGWKSCLCSTLFFLSMTLFATFADAEEFSVFNICFMYGITGYIAYECWLKYKGKDEESVGDSGE